MMCKRRDAHQPRDLYRGVTAIPAERESSRRESAGDLLLSRSTK